MTFPILGTRHQRWPDEGGCADAAAALASHRSLADSCIELQGPLGAGKTAFVRHLLHTLGVQGSIKSPTYTLMEPYEVERDGVPLSIAHFDFYRFEDPREWEDAGFREVFAAPGLKLVEWPEKAADFLPVPDLRLHIEPNADESRDVRIEAHTARGVELLS